MAGVVKLSRRREKRLFEAAVNRHFANNIEDSDLMVAALVARAKGGDVTAFTALRDTVDGKPHQSLDIEHDVSDNIKELNEVELVKIARQRMAGILPRRIISSVEAGGEERQENSSESGQVLSSSKDITPT